jgi:hypothetical protein
LEALNEEWEWVRLKGYIGPQRDNPNPDFIDITRAGRKFIEEQEKLGQSAGGPDASREPSVEDAAGVSTPGGTGLPGALAALPAWARTVIAARCAARAFPLFIPVKSRPPEKARADIRAVEMCWKAATLAGQAWYQSRQVVESLAAAVADARNATTDEHNSSFDAAELAIAAARCSQQPGDIGPLWLVDAVRTYELAFVRFAEGRGPDYRAVAARATQCLNDDVAALEGLAAKLGEAKGDDIRERTDRPLWWRRVFNAEKELSPMIEPWRTRLLELGLRDVFTGYMGLVMGTAKADRETIRGELSRWAAEAGARDSTGMEYVKLDATVAEPPSAAERPTLRMLADIPVEDETADLLGFKAYAYALAGLIDNRDTKTPLTLAINAPWGAGKTSLARMIRTVLERKPEDNKEKRHVTCWFDAWMHDDAPNLASSLAAAIAQHADSCRPIWSRVLRPVPATLRRGRAWPLWAMVLDVSLAALVVCEYLFPKLGSAVLHALPKCLVGLTSTFGPYIAAVILVFWIALQAIAAVAPAAKSIADFVRDPKRSARTASVNEVSSQLGKLIRQATPKGSRFVIFIDDLERCRPPRAVDVLEVVNQLLAHEGVVTVVMGDMAAIAHCAEVKYKELGL